MAATVLDVLVERHPERVGPGQTPIIRGSREFTERAAWIVFGPGSPHASGHTFHVPGHAAGSLVLDGTASTARWGKPITHCWWWNRYRTQSQTPIADSCSIEVGYNPTAPLALEVWNDTYEETVIVPITQQ